MARTIHKHVLMEADGRQTRKIVEGRNMSPLFVGMQAGQLCMWVEVQEDDPPTTHHFTVYSTGLEIGVGSLYVDSCQEGRFVWHVYRDAV